jgi:hypothetical protein
LQDAGYAALKSVKVIAAELAVLRKHHDADAVS